MQEAERDTSLTTAAENKTKTRARAHTPGAFCRRRQRHASPSGLGTGGAGGPPAAPAVCRSDGPGSLGGCGELGSPHPGTCHLCSSTGPVSPVLRRAPPPAMRLHRLGITGSPAHERGSLDAAWLCSGEVRSPAAEEPPCKPGSQARWKRNSQNHQLCRQPRATTENALRQKASTKESGLFGGKNPSRTAKAAGGQGRKGGPGRRQGEDGRRGFRRGPQPR